MGQNNIAFSAIASRGRNEDIKDDPAEVQRVCDEELDVGAGDCATIPKRGWVPGFVIPSFAPSFLPCFLPSFLPSSLPSFLRARVMCFVVILANCSFVGSSSISEPSHPIQPDQSDPIQCHTDILESNPLGGRFFVYDDPVYEICPMGEVKTSVRGGKEDVVVVRSFLQHSRRTYNRTEATFFIVPSVFIFCNLNLSEEVRYDKAAGMLEFLKAEPSFRATRGRNHFMSNLYWEHAPWSHNSIAKLLRNWTATLENVTIGRHIYLGVSPYETADCKPWANMPGKTILSARNENTRRTVVLPTPSDPRLPLVRPDFTGWASRQVLIFYHTRTSGSGNGATPLRHFFHDMKPLPNCSIGYDIPREQWVKGWSQSKFCLVIRGDDPASHAFSNAIASGCIPVVVSDMHQTFTPFGLDIHSFAIVFPERYFLADKASLDKRLLSFSEQVIRSKLDNLRLVQPKMLYRDPDSEVVDLVLEEMRLGSRHRCRDFPC